jgi:hypothetical protein
MPKMAEGSMKVMKQTWCWIGLVVLASSTAWAAKEPAKHSAKDDDEKSASKDDDKKSASKDDDKKSASKDDDKKSASKDDDEKAASDTKKPSSAEADAQDEANKDETADEEETTKPPPKKAAKDAKTPPPKSSSALNMGLLAGVGTSPFTRLGIGLRGGLTLGEKEGLYLGVIGTFFKGTSVTQRRLTSPPDAERTRNAVVIGAEVGYDVLASDDIIIRPYLSPGFAYVSDKTCATGQCWNDNGARLTLAPGLQGVYSFGPAFVGADLRYQIILNTTDASAAVMSLTGGLRI